MRKFVTLAFALLMASMTFAAEPISLKALTDGTFDAQRMTGIDPVKGTDLYARISQDGKKIVQYSFKTGQQTAVLFDVNNTQGEKISSFDGYIMSPDGTKMLISTNRQRVYRRSYKADFYIYTIKSRKARASVRRRSAAESGMVAQRSAGGFCTRQQHLSREVVVQ